MKNLFTPDSLTSLVGATTMLLVVTNTYQYLFNKNPKFIGIIVAFIISLGGVYFMEGGKQEYFIGVFNALLLYANAVGIMQIGGKENKSPKDSGLFKSSSNETDPNKRHFLQKWY